MDKPTEDLNFKYLTESNKVAPWNPYKALSKKNPKNEILGLFEMFESYLFNKEYTFLF